jgi:exosortase
VRLAALLPLLTAAVVTYWDVAAGLLRQWMDDANYAHGILVPPLAAWFAWRQRRALAAAPRAPNVLGLPIVGAGLALLVAGHAAAELFLTRVSLIVVIAGATLYLLGAGHLRILAFPIAFVALMVPLPAIVFNQITLPLQLAASTLGELALRAIGVAVRREGNVLELASMQLEVAEACSGIRSLVMLLTFAIAFGRLNDYPASRTVVLALSTVPVAVLANAARVVGTGYAAHAWGPDTAGGFLHGLSGALVFCVAVAVLLVVDRLVRESRVRGAHA